MREVALTYGLPKAAIRAVRMHSLSLTVAVRNLALWTRYTGPDPEVSNTDFANVQAAGASGGNVVNNDVRSDFGAVPLLRYWVVRLNAGF